MRTATQFGTRFCACVLVGVLGACTGSSENSREDSGLDASDNGHDAITDAGVQAVLLDAGECVTHSDCTLVVRGCGCCRPTAKDSFVAVPSAAARETQQAFCPAGALSCPKCSPTIYDPLAPILRAACTAGHCEVLDVREQELSSCHSDAECTVQSRGCCPACGEDPIGYLAIRAGADASVLACPIALPCDGCVQGGAQPDAYCASDGHCAVRGVERADGGVSRACVSPNQNLDLAYNAGIVGCDCAAAGFGVCRADATGRRVGLVCGDGGRWRAVEDGPCAP